MTTTIRMGTFAFDSGMCAESGCLFKPSLVPKPLQPCKRVPKPTVWERGERPKFTIHGPSPDLLHEVKTFAARSVKTALLLFGISTVIFAANAGELKVGDRAPSGNLIIHIFGDWSDKSDPPILGELTTDYGFMVFNDGDEKQPMPRFELATRASATVQNFNTLEEFEVALAKLPKGSVLQLYTKCGAPTWWGYHKWHDPLMLKMKQLGLTFSADGYTTCVCPRGH